VQVTHGRSSFKLVGLKKDDFPEFPTIPKAKVKLEANLLADCVKKTSFAMSAEESRYLLNGALLKLKPDGVTMVATDGHRLALVERKVQLPGFKEELSVLIPRKALASLRRLAEEDSERGGVEISKDGSHVHFVLGSRILASRLLTGEFPNYEAILPKESERAVELNREALEAVVRRVSLLADDRLRGVRLALETNQLEVSASSPEYGEAKEFVEVRCGQESLQIGFNAEYLLEFLGAVGTTDSIRMQVKDAGSAAEFRPSGNDGEHYRYVLMPLRF
jgi:DNA polymerase-3 subunit beta